MKYTQENDKSGKSSRVAIILLALCLVATIFYVSFDKLEPHYQAALNYGQEAYTEMFPSEGDETLTPVEAIVTKSETLDSSESLLPLEEANTEVATAASNDVNTNSDKVDM